ncbi:hypothetical protein FI667_g10796, partial [Globisporangium splendens]
MVSPLYPLGAAGSRHFALSSFTLGPTLVSSTKSSPAAGSPTASFPPFFHSNALSASLKACTNCRPPPQRRKLQERNRRAPLPPRCTLRQEHAARRRSAADVLATRATDHSHRRHRGHGPRPRSAERPQVHPRTRVHPDRLRQWGASGVVRERPRRQLRLAKSTRPDNRRVSSPTERSDGLVNFITTFPATTLPARPTSTPRTARRHRSALRGLDRRRACSRVSRFGVDMTTDTVTGAATLTADGGVMNASNGMSGGGGNGPSGSMGGAPPSGSGFGGGSMGPPPSGSVSGAPASSEVTAPTAASTTSSSSAASEASTTSAPSACVQSRRVTMLHAIHLMYKQSTTNFIMKASRGMSPLALATLALAIQATNLRG